MSQTLFDKYGGLPTISNIVHDFYHDVLDNELLNPYFKKVNMATLMNHQVQLFSHLMGGPVQFDLNRLRTAHAGLSINDEAFQTVANILKETLEDAGMEEEDSIQIMQIVSSTYNDIVSV